MNLDSFDLVASLQALPETDPIEIDGVQFDGGGGGGGGGSPSTCNKICSNLSAQIDVSVCVAGTCS